VRPDGRSVLVQGERTGECRSRQQTAGERLLERRRELKHYVCVLRDHSEFGTEAQFLPNGEFYIRRTFSR
jgi:hypothetical protein